MTGEETPDVAVVVLSTAPDRETADRLARSLLDEQLAACVSMLEDVRSVYRWQGRIEEGSEVLMVIKSHARIAPDLTKRLAEIHPYEVPEILVLPVAAGSRDYLDWIQSETRTET